jgi:hypothetical protein
MDVAGHEDDGKRIEERGKPEGPRREEVEVFDASATARQGR